MGWLNKNIVRMTVTGEEHILFYDGGEAACVKVAPYVDPLVGFAQHHSVADNQVVTELSVSGMKVTALVDAMFSEPPRYLTAGYPVDELEMLYPVEMLRLKEPLEQWTWDAVAKLYPRYAMANRPTEKKKPYVRPLSYFDLEEAMYRKYAPIFYRRVAEDIKQCQDARASWALQEWFNYVESL